MTTVKDIAQVIEQFAPLVLQEDFDNCGLLVGDPSREAHKALLCVDITEEILQEAVAVGADIIISHHPIIFHPLRRLTDADYVERIVARAIKCNIALYASHTNLDSAVGGMSWRLAEQIGLADVSLLGAPKAFDPATGFGVVGTLTTPEEPRDFLLRLKKLFSLSVVRHNEICRTSIVRVALSSGSGASLIPAAKASGADIFIAADFKYNDFISADKDIIVADIGHYESEYCAIELLFDVIRKKIPIFALHKSTMTKNPVNYI